MNAETQNEIAADFGTELSELQFRRQGYRDGRTFDTYGIFPFPIRTRPEPLDKEEATPRLQHLHIRAQNHIRSRASTEQVSPDVLSNQLPLRIT